MSEPCCTPDPELLRQIEEAERKGGTPVTAVLQLKQAGELASRVFERVTEATGLAPERVNVLKNLPTAIVQAAPGFLRHLLRQPEVRSATANEQPESLLIRPVKKRDVPED